MKRAFVLGHPVAHSRSPLIHRHWLAQYGIAGSYEPVDVQPDALGAFLERLRGGEYVGGNVTIPLKELVATRCDQLDELAAMIGAVNTVTRQQTGSGPLLRGENTDHFGFTANLDEHAPDWRRQPGAAIVLGAGGAARAVLVALSRQGFAPIHVLNRTPARAEALAAELGSRLERPLLAGPLTRFAEIAPMAHLVVNTSAMGMHDDGPTDLPLAHLSHDALVTDIVYTPLRTPLLAAAADRGLRTVDGLGMLLHQAVPGFERWFGVRPEVTPELRALVEATL